MQVLVVYLLAFCQSIHFTSGRLHAKKAAFLAFLANMHSCDVRM
jgi:hypothetical protein